MEKLTCSTCKHIGSHYHDGICVQWHFCGKSTERRRDTMKPTGDFAQDFMDNFRTFFDASAQQATCHYYEEAPPLSDKDAALLVQFDDDGVARFRFFSDDNTHAHQDNRRLFERYDYADERRDGAIFHGYRLTDVGKLVRKRHLTTVSAAA